jgi:hypothetical protein
MRKFLSFAGVWSVLIGTCLGSTQEGLEPISQELAQRIGKQLSDEAAKIEKPQVKIEAQPEKSNGVHAPGKAGALVVPQKDLQPNQELADKFKTEKGASLAFLFLYNVTPVIGGKPVDPSQLRSVKLATESGAEHTVYVLLLSVRHLDNDEYHLYAYGHDEKPLVDARFTENAVSAAEPVAVDIKDADKHTQKGKVVITVFGKYQATFEAGHRPD